MCGIGGVYYFKKKTIVDQTLLKGMADAMSHRGPDGSGFYADSFVGLCHRRLSIIDLSKKAKQPMSNEDKTIWLVFNGEIYNFQELKNVLEAKGHHFVSNTDSEIIVHAYEEFGEACTEYLQGMFAFAVWDLKSKKFFLARDRVGKKPLFYYKDNDHFIFASELKSILLDTAVKREISHESISYYLSFGYIPAPISIFKGIKKIRPGHSLTIDNKGNIAIRQYWNIKLRPEHHSMDYFKKKILHELEEAVRIRMISDVPLGAFLSGGIDSSAVVAIMSKLSSEPIKTFSIGFDEPSFDETKHARRVAECFGTDHQEFIVQPDAIKILPKLVWHYDEPYSDSSALPSFYLAKMTKKHVTVALNGDGGDENFAGYDRYAANNMLRYYRWIPATIRNSIFQISKLIPESITQKNLCRKIKRVVYASCLSKEKAYISFMQTFTDEQKNDLLSEDMYASVSGTDSSKILLNEFANIPKGNFTNQMLYCDIKRYLPDDLLVKMDIATMANSLEARSPFLDHKFMEFAATIPPCLKLHGFNKKYILKQALSPLLPKSILNRRKMGFGAPIGKWFRNDLKSFAADTLLSNSALRRGYFNSGYIRKILDQHNSGHIDNSYRIWNLLWLELWHNEYIDKNIGGR